MKKQKLRIIQLHEKDNVVVILETLKDGDIVVIGDDEITITGYLEIGHKLASRNIIKGEQIIKYGISIGRAYTNIGAGSHVHTHNIESNYIPSYTLN